MELCTGFTVPLLEDEKTEAKRECESSFRTPELTLKKEFPDFQPQVLSQTTRLSPGGEGPCVHKLQGPTAVIFQGLILGHLTESWCHRSFHNSSLQIEKLFH